MTGALSPVVVGLDASPPPPMHSGHPGEGFEVDLMKAIAERVGFHIRYESALWSDLVQRLVDGSVDMICSAATITPERQRLADFSAPYLSFQLALVARRTDRRVLSMRDVTDRIIGVRVATTAERFVRNHASERLIRTYHFNEELYAALRSRTVDAVVDDHPIANAFQSRMPELEVAAAIDGTTSHYGIMFAKGNVELRTRVDAALSQLRHDGTYDALARTWFPGLDVG